MTGYDAPRPEVPDSRELTAKCTMCGAADGVLCQDNGAITEHFCRECTRHHALYTAAYEQLRLLTRQAVRVWLHIWGDLPGMADFEEQLRHVGSQLDDERRRQ